MNRTRIVRYVGVVVMLGVGLLSTGCGKGPGAGADVAQTSRGIFGGGAGGAGEGGSGSGSGGGFLDGEMLANLDPSMMAAAGISKNDLVNLYLMNWAAHPSNWNNKLLRGILNDRSLTTEDMRMLAEVVIEVGLRTKNYELGGISVALDSREDAEGLKAAIGNALRGMAIVESSRIIADYGVGMYTAPLDFLLPGRVAKLKDAKDVGQAVVDLTKVSVDTLVQRYLDAVKKARTSSIG